MVQSIDPAAQAALNTHKIRPIGAIEFQFGEGTYRYWQGLGDRTFDGNVFDGAADLIDVREISSNIRGEPQTVEVRISTVPNSALDPDALAQLETTNYKFRPVIIYTAYIDIDTDTLLDLVTEFSGYADTVRHEIAVGGERTAVMSCESKALDLKRITGQVAGPEDQKQIDALDGFLNHCARTSDVEIDWGVEEKVAPDRGRRRRRRR